MKPTLATFATLAVSLLSGNAFGAAEIHLLPTGQANGNVVRLADIADITSDAAAETEALGEIELGPAPNQGRPQKFTLAEIRERLSRQGVNVGECRFYGASRIEVIGREGNVRPALATKGQGAVKRSSFSPDLQGQERERNEFRSTVETQEPAAKPLMLVKRGEAVSLTVRAAGVKISTAAVAQADGAEGELVVVRSAADRKKTFLARVIGPQSVEIQAGASVSRDNPSTRNGQ